MWYDLYIITMGSKFYNDTITTCDHKTFKNWDSIVLIIEYVLFVTNML